MFIIFLELKYISSKNKITQNNFFQQRKKERRKEGEAGEDFLKGKFTKFFRIKDI